jgi:hypothetical protein
MEDDEPSEMDYVLAVLADARASGLTIDDLIAAAEHAHCLGCWDAAVSMLGIGAIDTSEYRFEFTYR